MHDAAAEPTSAAWLAEYRRERLSRLESENTMLRTELERAYRWIASLAFLAGRELDCDPLVVVGVIEETDEIQRLVERIAAS